MTKKVRIIELAILLVFSNVLLSKSLAEDLNKESKDIIDITQLINKEPNNAEYYIKRADYYSCSNKDLAIKDYNKAIELQPNKPEYYLKRADFYNCQYKQDLAVKDYSKAIEVSNGDIKYYLERGDYYSCIGKKDLALSDYNKIIELYPNNYIGYKKRGILYQDQNEFEISSKDHIKSIELNPKETSEYYNLSYCYKKLEKYDLAIKTINKCIEKDSSTDNLISAYTERGKIYYLLSDYNLASKDLSYSINLDPESPENIDAYRLRGFINYLYYSIDLGLLDYNKALDIDSQDSETLYKRAILYKNQKKYDLALEDLESIIYGDSTQEDVFDAYEKRVEIYVSLKKYELALKDISEVFDLDLDNEQLVSTYLLRAKINKEEKKYDLALNDISEALKLNPSESKLIDAYIEKTSIYTEKKDYDLALKEINYIIDEKKDSPYIALAYLERSTIYIFMGKEDKYEEDFETYKLKSEVDNSKEILEEASKLIKNGKRNEALNKIENALIDFTIINPFMNRSSYLLYFEASQICIENPEKALNLLSTIEEENDNLNELRYLTRFELFGKQIKSKKYKESYLTLIEMESDLNSNKNLKNKEEKKKDLMLDKKYFYSDMIYNDFKQHNFKNTLSKIDKLVELDKDNIEAIHMRGYTLFYLGKRNEGVQLVKKYVKLNPKSDNAYYNLACFYSILGKKDLSLKNLKISITINSKLKENAKKDKDFDNVKNLKEFKSLVI